jgi:hypothetical protein
MRSRPRFTPSLALVAIASSVGACVSEPPLATLNVQEIYPREADIGDRLEVIGEGFPIARGVALRFEGELHRAGGVHERAAISAHGDALGSSRVALRLDDALAADLCGAPARHTTFRGDVRVTFDPSSVGMPAIAGVVRGVVIDLCAADADAEGAQALADVGVSRVSALGGGRGASVVAIGSDSAAVRAGLSVGDVIESCNGVRVASVGDCAAAEGGELALSVAHSDPVTGVAPPPPARDVDPTDTRAHVDRGHELLSVTLRRPDNPRVASATDKIGLALAATGVALLLAFSAPIHAAIAWLSRNLRRRAAAPLRVARARMGSELGALALVCAVPTVFAQRASSLDLASLAVAVVTLACAVPIVRWLLVRGEASVVRSGDRAPRLALTFADLAVVATLTAWAAASTSSLFPVDWGRAQRGSIGAWQLFHDPFALALVVLGVASVARSASRSASRSESLEVALAVVVVICGLGAWNLPNVAIDPSSVPGAIAAGLVLASKTWAIVMVSRALAAIAPRVASTAAVARAYFGRLPLAVGLAVVSVVVGRSARATSVGHAVAASLVAFAIVASFALLARLRLAMRVVSVAHADPQI